MSIQLTDENYREAFAHTSAGLCIFFKKLCPHCKNMEKVLEKVAAREAGLTILCIDSEESPAAMQAYGAERAPTILALKNGAVAATMTGLMNPKEMLNFYQNA